MLALPLAGLCLFLGGCAPTQPALPSDVTVTIFETRFDAALRQVQLRVTNDSGAPLTVLRAELDSSRFVSPAVFERSQTVPSGSARDLPVKLGDAVCDDSPTSDHVRLEFELTDSSRGSVLLDIADTAILDAITEKECRIAAVASHATIVPPEVAEWTPGAGQPAILDFQVIPTGAAGSLTITDVGNTTLLGLVDESGARVTPLPVGVVITSDSEPTVIRLRVVPARCDPHAVAEDKQGTQFPLAIETSEGQSGQIRVAVSDEVRKSIYAFFADYCDLPD
jgi:hypothetical protein